MGKHADIQHRTGPVMTGQGLGLEPEISMEKSGHPWQPIKTSPKDGRPLWLKSEDGKIVEAYWRTTRQYRKGMWQPVSFWAVYGKNPQVVPFNPTLWTREDEYRAN